MELELEETCAVARWPQETPPVDVQPVPEKAVILGAVASFVETRKKEGLHSPHSPACTG